MTVIGLLSLIFAAMTCHCRASRYSRREIGRSATARARQRRFRLGGWLLLGFSGVLATVLFPRDIGLVFWLGGISLATLPLVGLASYRAHWLAPLLSLSLFIAVAATGWYLAAPVISPT